MGALPSQFKHNLFVVERYFVSQTFPGAGGGLMNLPNNNRVGEDKVHDDIFMASIAIAEII